MVQRFFLLISFLLVFGAYSPKAQFDKSDNTETAQQERQVSPQSVIGGVMGGAEKTNIQKEEADEDLNHQLNCAEALRVCDPALKENSSAEP
jgi:hypothetical protein